MECGDLGSDLIFNLYIMYSLDTRELVSPPNLNVCDPTCMNKLYLFRFCVNNSKEEKKKN